MEVYSQKSSPFFRWIFMGILLVLFIVLAALVVNGKGEIIDNPFITIFETMREPFVTTVTKGITFFANTSTIIVFSLILLFLPSRMKFGAPVVLITSVTALINLLLKLIIGRERPEEDLWLVDASGYSFPSGHTLTALVFYISLMILLRRYFYLRRQDSISIIITIIFSTLAVLIGFSRIYLGVHYPTDVFGGWLLGGIFLIIGVTLYDYMYPLKFLISYDSPAWGYIKKKKPWRKPVHPRKTPDMVDIPKFRNSWRKPKISPKAEREAQLEEERNRPKTTVTLHDAPIQRASQSKPQQNIIQMNDSPLDSTPGQRPSRSKPPQEAAPVKVPLFLIKIEDFIRKFLKKYFG